MEAMMAKGRIKRKSIKIFKKLSRETVPAPRLKGKVIPSKKRKLLEKTMFENEDDHI